MSERRPQLCVGAIAVFAERLLLIRRGRPPDVGRWSIPGGRVESGETVIEAVVRELAEETGLEGVCGPLVGWTEQVGDAGHFVILDFAVHVLDDQDPVAGDDALEATWVELSEVGEFDLVPGLLEFLADHGVVEVIA